VDQYFDRRENRWKPIPDCSQYGLTWKPSTQRCEYLDCVEQIVNYLDTDFWDDTEASRYRGWQGMGLALAESKPPAKSGGGFGIPSFDPISSIVGGVFDVIGGLVGSARQRGSDEARSGVALQASVDGIYYLQRAVQDGDVSKKEARDAFYLKILPAFLEFISTLQTKSVVDSRLKNQRQDLINLFEKEVNSLPDSTQSPPFQQQSGDDDLLPDNTDIDVFGQDFGYEELYTDDGGYYYEDDSGWYYEDAAGNYQQMDSDGNLYAGNDSTGEYWQTNSDGTSYWEGSDGSYYQEYSDGSWISGDALGNECTGDVAGNWVCEDGSGGGDWRESPVRIQKQSGQTRRQQQIPQSTFDKYLKQAIALIPKQQRQQQNAQRAQTARATTQRTNAQQRLASPVSNIGGASGSNPSMNLLLIGGIAVGAFILLRNR